tara:strand:+ start:863 stop:1024 length:162 start_codon:yes stop_codon:yes gene_type:complete
MVRKILRSKIPKDKLNQYGWPNESYRFEGYSAEHGESLWSLIPQLTTFEEVII